MDKNKLGNYITSDFTKNIGGGLFLDFTHYWALPYNLKKEYEMNTETLRQYHNKAGHLKDMGT
jgi:endonuclease IV